MAPDGIALVPYRGPRGTFKYISATEVMQDKVPADAFAGAIVLVSTSAKGLQDLRPTPVAPDYPGVEIHASLLTGMLNDEMLSAPPGANETLAIAMVIGGLLALFALPYRRPVISTLGVLALMAVAIGGDLYLWHAWRLVYPLAPLLVLLVALGALNLLTGFVREANAIRQLSDMFGEYVPREQVEQMRESGERFSMQGESREMTVLFSDVRNFTALSENLTPAELSAMLNTYLTRITEIIHTHHGTIDKYIGDAVMAFWGAPLANARHATDALRASLAMNAVLPALRDEFVARGWPALSIGAGINSGTMNVGDMGSQFRKAYTVLGDAVNLASRLEGLTKVYGVPILIGEDTRIAAGRSSAAKSIACELKVGKPRWPFISRLEKRSRRLNETSWIVITARLRSTVNASSTTLVRRSNCSPPIAPNLLSMPSTRSALLSSRPLLPHPTGMVRRRSRRNR